MLETIDGGRETTHTRPPPVRSITAVGPAALHPDRSNGRWSTLLRAGFLIAFGLTLVHVLALPLVIPYDGHEYIDFAAVLFSDRFPRDWQPPIRTPGYPLALRAAFELFGRQPLAVVAVNAAFAAGMLAIIAALTRRLAGDTAAAAAVMATALFPLSIAYQHHALTESGMAFLLVLTAGCLLLPAATPRSGWLKAAALIGTLTAGYYHRQSMQFVLPAAAGLFALSILARPGDRWRSSVSRAPYAAWILGLQTVAVLLVPIGLARLWEPYAPSKDIRSYMIKQGIVRQAVIPPGDPILGEAAADYAVAVDEGWQESRLISGIKPARIGELAGNLYPVLEPPTATLARLAATHPGRYLAGVGRTLLLYAGYPVPQSTNWSAEHAAFGPALAAGHNQIDEGLLRLTSSTRRAFSEPAAPSLVSAALWGIAPLFDHGIVPLGMVALVGLVAVGLWQRDIRLIIVAAVPLAYLLGHAAMLAAEDRYAFPAQPFAVAAIAALATRAAANFGASPRLNPSP